MFTKVKKRFSLLDTRVKGGVHVGWSQHPSMYQTHPRGGPSAPRTTSKPGPGSAQHAQHAATTATAMEGSSKSSSSLAAALAQRPAGGYSALAGGQRGCGEGRDLVAGTANGRARWIDVEQGMLKADLYCRPLSKGQVRVSLPATPSDPVLCCPTGKLSYSLCAPPKQHHGVLPFPCFPYTLHRLVLSDSVVWRSQMLDMSCSLQWTLAVTLL